VRRRDIPLGRAAGFAFVVAAAAAAVSLVPAEDAAAQPARRAPARPTTKRPPKPPAEEPDAAAPMAGRESETAVRDAGGGGASKGGGVVDQRTLDGGTRVFRFGEVEIEGRLKSPQIVYFLRRVRAEFAAGDLGHRSFMTELSETKNEPGF
jgi:hypothetical protein